MPRDVPSGSGFYRKHKGIKSMVWVTAMWVTAEKTAMVMCQVTVYLRDCPSYWGFELLKKHDDKWHHCVGTWHMNLSVATSRVSIALFDCSLLIDSTQVGVS